MSTNQKWIRWCIMGFCLALFSIFLIFIITKNGNLYAYDEFISQFFFNHRARFFDYVFVIFSYLGESKVIALFCIILLLLPNRKQVGIPVAIITLLSAIINLAIKLIVMRARPDGMFLTEPTLFYSMPSGYSFPSGHAQTGTVFFMSFSLLLSFAANRVWQQRLYVLSGVAISALMCLARIYLGVHYFSDVVCGLCLAITIICFGYIMHNKFIFNRSSTLFMKA